MYASLSNFGKVEKMVVDVKDGRVHVHSTGPYLCFNSVWEAKEFADQLHMTVKDSGHMGLAKWLRTNEAEPLLDDAVMGCIPDSQVIELFADYELEDTKENREWFDKEMDTVLTKENG